MTGAERLSVPSAPLSVDHLQDRSSLKNIIETGRDEPPLYPRPDDLAGMAWAGVPSLTAGSAWLLNAAVGDLVKLDLRVTAFVMAFESGAPPTVRYIRAAFCAAVVVALFLLVWFGRDTLLLAFAAVLLSIAFRSAAGLVARLTGASPGWSLAVALVVAAGLVAGFLILIGPQIAAQTDQLRDQLPRAWDQAQEKLRQFELGRELIDRLSGPGKIFSQGYQIGRVFTAFSTVVSVLGSIVILGFLSLYFAADPDLYRRGVLKLVSKDQQERAGEVFDHVGDQLRRWLLGKLALMLFVGIATTLGLWILHMPLIAALAMLAALLDFIPNIGPIISAIPALLLASMLGGTEVLLVGGLYLIVQVVESYILAPLVQQRAVSLPPAVNLLAQILIGSLIGPLGLILATPLTVTGITVIEALYIEDFLNKRDSR
jgi:predicted PurR-regulated permease PerM